MGSESIQHRQSGCALTSFQPIELFTREEVIAAQAELEEEHRHLLDYVDALEEECWVVIQ
jgi:hypothetical protein